jgi:hypothetical protein
MALEHVARLGFRARNAAIQLALNGGIKPQLRQLAEQLGFAFLDLGYAFGRAGHALGQLVFLAADIAHGFFKAGQRLGSTDAHAITTVSPRRP